MPEIRLGEGEAKEIVPEIDTGTEYAIRHLSGGSVNLDHNRRDVTNNPAREITVGDEGTLNNFKGSSVWAYAPDDDATLRVTESRFSLTLFSNKTVERPTDKAVRVGDVGEASTSASLPANGSVSEEMTDGGDSLGANGPVVVELLNFNLRDGFAEDMDITLDLLDGPSGGGGQSIFTAGFNPGASNSLTFDPGLPIPEGGEAYIAGADFSGTATTLQGRVYYRRV